MAIQLWVPSPWEGVHSELTCVFLTFGRETLFFIDGWLKHSDVYCQEGASSVMLLCPVVINRPSYGVICVGSNSKVN